MSRGPARPWKAEREQSVAGVGPGRVLPLIDTNALLAIESLFSRATIDPWAVKLASTFTDVFAYGDAFRFTFGSSQSMLSDADWANTPTLVQLLRQRDSSAVVPLVVPTNETIRIHDDYLAEAFQRFVTWARNNRRTLRQWLDTHKTAKIQAMQQAQVAREYYFDLDRLTQKHDLEVLVNELRTRQSELLYAFDNVLRAPLYGKLAGSGQHYLNHPLRNASLLPTFEAEEGALPRIAISFRDSMAKSLGQLSLDEYCILLHELRAAVRDRGLHQLGPGDVEKEVLRDIAASVSLPPRLRGVGRLALFAGGIIGGLAAVPSLGPATAVAGAVVSLSSALWTGQLPRSAARIRWMRWSLEWDLENQAESRRKCCR